MAPGPLEELSSFAEKNGRTIAQLAIAWVLSRPEVTAAIVGARRLYQIEETVVAGDWVLSKNDIATIEAILGKYKETSELGRFVDKW